MLKQYKVNRKFVHNNRNSTIIPARYWSIVSVKFFIYFIISYHITSYETKYLLSINWSEMTKIFCFLILSSLFFISFIINYYIKSCHNYKWWFYHLLKILNKAYLYVIVLFIINKSWIRPKLVIVIELKKLTFSCMLFIFRNKNW